MGERRLDVLLATLDPVLDPTPLVYATVPPGDPVPDVEAVVRVQEEEGTTLVLAPRVAAAHDLRHEFRCRRIELRVHSDLAAVGLTAAIATALTDAGISANVVAGFFHDHVLVPERRAEEAVAVLRALAAARS